MHDFVSTCESYQMHSVVRHRDELRPTYPLTVHLKWMVDLVTMLMGEGQKRYLVLAREDLTNQVEGRALTRMTTPVAGKRIKAFKRRNEVEPDAGAESANSEGEDE